MRSMAGSLDFLEAAPWLGRREPGGGDSLGNDFLEAAETACGDAAVKEAAHLADTAARSASTDHLNLLAEVFAKALARQGSAAPRLFHLLVPILGCCFLDSLLFGRELLAKRAVTPTGAKGDAVLFDDGFAVGVAFVLRVFGLDRDFQSLHWFQTEIADSDVAAGRAREAAGLPFQDSQRSAAQAAADRRALLTSALGQLAAALEAASALFGAHAAEPTAPEDHSFGVSAVVLRPRGITWHLHRFLLPVRLILCLLPLLPAILLQVTDIWGNARIQSLFQWHAGLSDEERSGAKPKGRIAESCEDEQSLGSGDLDASRGLGSKGKDLSHSGNMGPATLTSVSAAVVDKVEVKTALVSVFDKAGLEDLGKFLASKGVHILSTGGTAAKLRDLGCTVQDVADYTGSPEILDGRVKTLHPKVHGGLLAARGNAGHEAEMEKHGIRKIDLVVVNLYPFQEAVAKGGDFATCIENIDIGGPAMIRASAKNNAAVTILTSPSQYGTFMQQVSDNAGCTTFAFRKNMAAAAYALTSSYDSAVSAWMAGEVTEPPAKKTLTFDLQMPLKYGCNPHQLPAGLCAVAGGKLPFEVLNGTPGYINLLDARTNNIVM
eukprot:s575_g6.t1